MLQHTTPSWTTLLVVLAFSIFPSRQTAFASTISLGSREAPNDTLIDLTTAPSCSRSNCVTSDSWSPAKLGCFTNDDVTHECFCRTAYTPLLCQPYTPTIDDTCFFSLLKWFHNVCEGSVKTISYNVLPECSRPCLKTLIPHLGCPDESLNCVCQLPYMADNAAKCIKSNCDKDYQLYIGSLEVFTRKWFEQSCNFNLEQQSKDSPAAAPQAILSGEFQDDTWYNWKKGLEDKEKKKKNQPWIITISLFFGLIGFGCLVVWVVAACK